MLSTIILHLSVNSLMLLMLACFSTFFLTSSRAELSVAEPDEGLLVREGRRALMLDKAAVMEAAVILAIAGFMAMGRLSEAALDLRLEGTGIPAFTHMAAALALAISNSCSLSSSLMRWGLLELPCFLPGDLFLRRMSTGE